MEIPEIKSNIKPLEVTMTQRFEMEKYKRIIDSTDKVDDLRKIAKTLLEAWYSQKAATAWVMHQNLDSPSSFR